MKSVFGIVTATLLVLVAAEVSADDEHYETVLFPLALSTPVNGSNGSRWFSQIAICNFGDVEVASYHGWYEASSCPIAAPCPIPIPPNTCFDPPIWYYFSPRGPEGLLFYPPREVSASLAYSLRLLNLANSTNSIGTELPVVRDRDFRGGRVDVISIPITADSRISLRVYAPRCDLNLPATIFLADFASGNVVAETRIDVRRVRFENEGFPKASPGFAVVGNLLESFPALASIERLNLRVVSDDPSAPLWAMVSITNNETDEVTVLTSK